MTSYNATPGHPISGITLSSGDFASVSSGGTATNVTVDNDAALYIFSGGVASFTVLSGGFEYVSSGGMASGSVVSGGTEVVDAGGSANFTVVSGDGGQDVYLGGTAIGTTVSGGIQGVYRGGTASGTVVINGGGEYVYSGGSATATVVKNGGTQFVFSMGVASGTVISAGGTVVVNHGDTIGFAVVSPGGAIDFPGLAFSGGSATVSDSDLLTVIEGSGSATLQLAGSYEGASFVTSEEPEPNEGTVITLVEAPRTLLWTGATNTSFGVAANWNDLTNAEDPATVAPDATDTVEFLTSGEFLASGGTIAGFGTAAVLEFGGAAVWNVTSSANLTAASSVTVGTGGAGMLLISNQGTVQIGNDAAPGPAAGLDIAPLSGASGEVNVSGANSLLMNTGRFVVGDGGMGSLSIVAGASVVTAPSAGSGLPGLVIADTASADGSSVNLTGAGSNLRVTGLLDVGVDGSGGLSISDGASVTAGTLDAGNVASAVADIIVSDADFTVTGDATVADDGTGVMSVVNGATFTVGNLTIGSQGDSSGALVVSGEGSVVNIAGELNVGTALGTGDLTIGPGATVNAKVINLQGEVVLENGTLDPTVNLINQGLTAGGSGAFAAGDIVDEGVLQAGASKASQRLLVVTGTIVGGGPWTINGTSQAEANGDVGVLQINAGGTMEINGVVSNAALTTFTDDVTPQSTYAVSDSVIDVNFEDAAGVLKLDNIAGFAGTITTFHAGDKFVITGGTLSGVEVNNGHTLTVQDSGHGGTDQIIFGSSVTASEFTILSGNTIQVACFAAGTRIATETSWLAVEALRVGDRVATPETDDLIRTADKRSEQIVWIGQRTVDCERHPKPETVWPVRIARGTFGDNVPVRDLFLSPDHAVFVNDVLVPVKLLINGTSIRQVKRDRVTYYHVELPHHAVILAEGLTVESYLDLGDRADFSGDGEVLRLFPDFAARLASDPALTWETRAAAPLVMAGDRLAAARGRVGSGEDLRQTG